MPTPRRAAIAALSTLLAACATNPVTGKREIALISEAQEIQMGQQGAADVAQSIGLIADQALQDYVQSGNLVGSAVPCGPEGIANNPGSFDSRVSQENVEKVSGQFANACARFTERSDSGDKLKTLSLISLGVGAFATVGTIVWYFSDTGGSSTETTGDASTRRQARITPLFSRDLNGVLLDVTF